MRLRSKMLAGFLVLALMLSVAGVWSIQELRSVSSAVQDLLDDNYRSITAAKTMLEALEREDSGVLLLMLGKWREGRDIINSADTMFAAGFAVASNNLTIPGEAAYIEAIRSAYASYRALWERPIIDTEREGNLAWYFESIHQPFISVKAAVNDLMTLNDETMFETATAHRQKANRAIMPGIVAILAALAFSIMFSYFVHLYVVRPIVQITQAAGQSLQRRGVFDIRLETNDELSDLAESIRTLIDRLDSLERHAAGHS